MEKGLAEIRRQRLLTLIDEIGEGKKGKQAKLAKVADYEASYISQIKTGHRKIGEDVARRLEKKTGKPPGWMDGIDRVSPLEYELLSIFRTGDKNHQDAILRVVKAMSESETPARPAVDIDHSRSAIPEEGDQEHRSTGSDGGRESTKTGNK